MARGICSKTVCIAASLEQFFTTFLLGATVLNLSVITLDRYIAIFHTYRYPELVTNDRVKILSAIIWVSWATVSVIAIIIDKFTLSIGVILITNVAFISILYARVFREVRRMDSNVVLPAPGPNVLQNAERRAADNKTTKSVGIILGSLVFSYILFILFAMRNRVLDKPLTRVQKEVLLLYARTAALSNSTTNVLIYYWRNEEMRKAMRKVLKKIRNALRNEN